MASGRKIAEIITTAVIFIAMEVAAIAMLAHKGEMQNFFLARWAHGVQARTWGATESVRYYFSLKKANDALAEENFALTQQLRALGAEAALEGQTPEAIGDFRYLPATVRKMSHGGQHSYLILDKGSFAGVTPNTGVITSCGVVGLVDAVSERYSYAVTFLNADFRVSARLGREGAVGPLVWDGKSTTGAILKEIPLQHRFAPGDTVFTSGFSSFFPADIPVGIVGESRVVNGATYEIQITLLQDFSAVRYVTLVTNDGLEEMTQLENGEGIR